MTTWGIDGPTFLAIHTAAVAATSAVAVLTDRRRDAAAGAGELDEYETAYLTGGAQLAAVVALVTLDRRGAIDLGDDLLRDLQESGDLNLNAVRGADHLAELGVELHVTMVRGEVAARCVRHPVEAAALQAVRGTKPPTPWRVVVAVTRTKAMGKIRSGLVERGLLHDADGVERLRGRWRWLLPLLAIGGARALVGVEGFLAVLVTLALMRLLGRRRPRNTRAGDKLVTDLRRRRPELVAEPVAGPSLGLALARTGTALLRASDPARALAVDVPTPEEPEAPHQGWRESARDWWRSNGLGSSAGSGCAGCGGGWGDGSGGDGGGSGCGGGGGGCGGGG